MSAPQPFQVMLAHASTHGRASNRRRAIGTDVDAGVRQHDDLDERVAAYLAAGPLEGREREYEIVTLIHDISNDLANLHRTVAICNIAAARMIGRMELAASEHHAWEVEHAH